MSRTFSLFFLQVMDILDLWVWVFGNSWFFKELAILQFFYTWCFKSSIVTVYTYFQRDQRWLNFVVYIGKCVDFVSPIWVTYFTRFFVKMIFLFLRENNKGEYFSKKVCATNVTNTKKHFIGTAQISENWFVLVTWEILCFESSCNQTRNIKIYS